VSLDVDLHVVSEAGDATDDRLACTCTARVAVPIDDNDNPWRRKGDDWRP
jgi:hypothetical protein